MSFVRPELALRIARWREAALWGLALGVGVLLLARGSLRMEPLVIATGAALALTGFALLRGALGRMRLGGGPPGPGVTVVDEARIGLLGPGGGGYVDVPALVAVEVKGAPGTASRAWVLTSEDGVRLVVPFGALGAERLPDALAALPGIDFAAADQDGATLWRRAPAASAAQRLPRG